MAGDKLKDGFPIAVSFAAGEQPSDTKLNGLANQTQNALQSLEQAIGDILDQSQALGGTNRLSNRDLQIANVGRLIGPASMLNPQILHDVRISDFEYAIPTGVKEFILPHPPLISGGASTIDWDGSARFTDEKVSVDDLSNAGDFYVDYNTGRVFIYSLTQAGDTATYDYDSIGDSFDNASLNVIPDPNQTTERCEVSTATGGFYVDLPFIKYDQEGALATDGSDPNYSDSGSIYNTLRAQLPSFLTVLSVGDIIPAGFVYLFDHNINTIVEGTTFKYESQTRLKVENVQLEIGSSRYSVLTIGAPLSEILYAVRKIQREHTHDSSDGGERIPHANLTGNIHEDYVPSAIAGNEHPHYLMRQGYVASSDPNNSDNALRGDLLIGSSTPSGNDYTNITADSKSLYFGDVNGPGFKYNQVYDALQLAAKDLMVDGNLTVGRSSGVDSNASYFGFGNDPANNHLVLDEANAAGSRFRFLIDGTTTGSDVEAGDFIAVGSSPPRFYFGDKTGTNDSYIQRDGTRFDVRVDDDAANSDFRVGTMRVRNNIIHFDEDTTPDPDGYNDEDYLIFNDASNSYDFYADGSRENAIITTGKTVAVSNEVYFGEKASNHRIIRLGSYGHYYFDNAGSSSSSNSRIYAGRLYLQSGGTTDWLDGAKIRQLVDTGYAWNPYGGGPLHKHYYKRAVGGWINTGTSDDWTGTISINTNRLIIGAYLRGFGAAGGQSVGDNDFYVWWPSWSTGNTHVYLSITSNNDTMYVYWGYISETGGGYQSYPGGEAYTY